MLLLPILVAAVAGIAVYARTRGRPRPTPSTEHASTVRAQRPLWPTSVEGRTGVGALVLTVAAGLLVNVIAVPYFGVITMAAALALSGRARFSKHDQSLLVLVALCVSALATLFGLLFLAGELIIGHD